jgi:hypothetical protein
MQHRAAEGLFECFGEIILAFEPYIKTAVLLGEAFGVEQARSPIHV